jgi:hypothetical protein
LLGWILDHHDLFFVDDDLRVLVSGAYESGALSPWALGLMLERFAFKQRALIPADVARLVVPPRDVIVIE